MGKFNRKRGEKKMNFALIILFGVLFVIAVYLFVQAIRCGIAVKEGEKRLLSYNARTADLSYGKMTYVDEGNGEAILSVHGIFGGYDQAFDTCKDFASDFRILVRQGSVILGAIFRERELPLNRLLHM